MLFSQEVGGYLKPLVYGQLTYYVLFWIWWVIIHNPFIEDSGPKTICGLFKDLQEEAARVEFMEVWDKDEEYLFYLQDTLGDNSSRFIENMIKARETISELEKILAISTYVRRTYPTDCVYEHYFFILYNPEVFVKYGRYIELYLFDALVDKLDKFIKLERKPKSERNVVDIRLHQDVSDEIEGILNEIDFSTKVIKEHLRDERVVKNMNELQENIEYVLLTKKHGYKPL